MTVKVTYELKVNDIAKHYRGAPQNFDFDKSAANFTKLYDILADAGMYMNDMVAITMMAYDYQTNQRKFVDEFFVIVGEPENPIFEWHRWDTGRNTIRFNQRELPLGAFIRMDAQERLTELVFGKRAYSRPPQPAKMWNQKAK